MKVGDGFIFVCAFLQTEDLFSIVEEYQGRELKMYVYNTDMDNCREVLITPNCAWGGEGRYGKYHCDIKFTRALDKRWQHLNCLSPLFLCVRVCSRPLHDCPE